VTDLANVQRIAACGLAIRSDSVLLSKIVRSVRGRSRAVDDSRRRRARRAPDRDDRPRVPGGSWPQPDAAPL